jgi:hypothetical protein
MPNKGIGWRAAAVISPPHSFCCPWSGDLNILFVDPAARKRQPLLPTRWLRFQPNRWYDFNQLLKISRGSFWYSGGA